MCSMVDNKVGFMGPFTCMHYTLSKQVYHVSLSIGNHTHSSPIREIILLAIVKIG